ncbi:MAG: metallophosphoesterase family protein [Dehalococcoidia bacterium]|nr:metallophosphoesterase family protein [Dehalococcoidia bacterium]
MKKTAFIWLAAFSAFLVGIFLIWVLFQPGAMGMLRVNTAVRLACLAIVIIAVLAVPVAWLSTLLQSHGRVYLGRVAIVLAIILALPGLLGIPTVFAVLSGLTQPNIGDTPPQLFVTASTGAHGLPDLALAFNTTKVAAYTLTWGKTAGQTEETILTEAAAVRTHAFILTDLEPNTDYYYRLGDGSPCTFRTAGDPLRFAVGADAHYGAATRSESASTEMLLQIADPQNAFSYFFLVGDTTHWGFSKSHWSVALRELAGTTATIPLGLAPGNHDTIFSGYDNYLRYAHPDSLLGDNSKLWTRIDVGRVHFFVIDLGWSAEAFTEEQAAWLESELTAVPAEDWKIILGHGFSYASGTYNAGRYRYDNPETIACLVPLFERCGVNLVFSGHNHQMEILEKSGVTYVISSPFGGIPSSPRTYQSPYSLWYESGQYGFADVTITEDEAEIVFRAPGGSEVYRHFLAKSQP